MECQLSQNCSLCIQQGPEGQVDGEGEEEEEEAEEELPTLSEVLSGMGLGDQLSTFQKEQIDYESLVSHGMVMLPKICGHVIVM